MMSYESKSSRKLWASVAIYSSIIVIRRRSQQLLFFFLKNPPPPKISPFPLPPPFPFFKRVKFFPCNFPPPPPLADSARGRTGSAAGHDRAERLGDWLREHRGTPCAVFREDQPLCRH